MNRGIIIQARVNSSRLPRKMVMPFYEEKFTIPYIIISRLKNAFPDIPVVLATTNTNADSPLVDLANELKIEIWRGDENNVLSRFIDAAEHFGFTNVVRICADNPFLSSSLLQGLIDIDTGEGYDYLSYKMPEGRPVIKSHLGLFSELVSLKALKKVAELTNEKLYLEHVTNFIYAHPEHFNIKLQELPFQLENIEGIRLTTDTIQDFTLQQEIFNSLNIQEKGFEFNLDELLKFLEQNLQYRGQMKQLIELNSK